MIDAESVFTVHSACGCLLTKRLVMGAASYYLNHQKCKLVVAGLRLAIDCDRCSAFGPNDPRPDLLVLRDSNGACEWIVIEIKHTMDRAAINQVEAGLRILDQSPLFADSRDCNRRVCSRLCKGCELKKFSAFVSPYDQKES